MTPPKDLSEQLASAGRRWLKRRPTKRRQQQPPPEADLHGKLRMAAITLQPGVVPWHADWKLTVIEGERGSGKTTAACWLADALCGAGNRHWYYFGDSTCHRTPGQFPFLRSWRTTGASEVYRRSHPLDGWQGVAVFDFACLPILGYPHNNALAAEKQVVASWNRVVSVRGNAVIATSSARYRRNHAADAVLKVSRIDLDDSKYLYIFVHKDTKGGLKGRYYRVLLP